MSRLKIVFTLVMFHSFVTQSLAIDRNSNGLCDVWEARYAVGSISPDGDADGNGISNRLESIAGTNPFDTRHDFRISSISASSGVVVKVPSIPGKCYRLFSAATLTDSWTPVGAAIEASAAELQFPVVPMGGNRSFFRVEVSDIDSDGDGVSNWAEKQIEGLNPANTDSFAAGQANADLTFAQSWLDTLSNGALQLSSTIPDAFEKEASTATFTFTRSTPLAQPYTVFFRNTVPPQQGVGIAASSDFVAKNASGSVLTDRIVIPAGQATTTLHLHPTPDTISEVPEHLLYKIGGSSLEIAGRICDAMPTEQNVKLLIAYLAPRLGVATQGSGMAAVRLAGDNASAIVTVNFSNLKSLASSAHIETSNSNIILSVPPFRYNGQAWAIKANQHYTHDQQVLDALLSGNFQFNVYTEMASSGEIAGAFQAVNATTAFQQPAAPEPISPLTGDALDREIVRFLTQATFGATWGDLLAMRTRIANHNGDRIAAFNAWIDEQIAIPAPSHQRMTTAGNALERAGGNSGSLYQMSRQTAWWTCALHSPDQLRQRLTFALSQILVISDEEATITRMGVAMANYYDTLQANAFGLYRNTLQDITLHTNMGQYLSHIRNQKAQLVGGVVVASPDENFAREIMQLFSIGLVKLHPDGSIILGPDGLPIPTYNQEDITEIAKVFTGWSFSKRAQTFSSNVTIDNNDFFAGSSYEEHAIRWSHPMKLFPNYHDETAKHFLGHNIPARVGGGTQDLSETLDLLTNHPNTAPFICRQLIQRFTTSTPSAGYIHRVGLAYTASNGNLGTTLKAILLDPEARNPSNADTSFGFGKSKEMIIRHTAAIRALDARSAIPIQLFENYGYPASETAKFPSNARIARFRSTTSSLAQTPLNAPSVFNWYRPDYAPAGSIAQNGFFSPEFQIVNENNVVRSINYHYYLISSSNGQNVSGLPSGLNLAGITNFISYDGNSDNIKPDLSAYRALYLSVLDTNLDGAFSSADTTWPNRLAKMAEAVELIVDRADLLLCAGSLKARYGSTANLPRRLIIDAVIAVESQDNNNTNASIQTDNMNERIFSALHLIMKTPNFIIQK